MGYCQTFILLRQERIGLLTTFPFAQNKRIIDFVHTILQIIFFKQTLVFVVQLDNMIELFLTVPSSVSASVRKIEHGCAYRVHFIFVYVFSQVRADRDEDNYAYYVLANRNDHVAMYRLGTAAIPQYRAYLMLPISEANTTAGIIEHVAFSFGLDDDNTSVVSEDGGFVDAITAPQGTDATVIGIYAPNGSRLQGMRKGVNIIQMSNGTTKKIIR